MTERTCATCAWGTPGPQGPNCPENIHCHYEPITVGVGYDWWCRHHSFTTGWADEVEDIQEIKRKGEGKMPTALERGAASIFMKMYIVSGSGPTPKRVHEWMKAYRQKWDGGL